MATARSTQPARKLIFDWQEGRGPDGFKMDQKGRLYVAAGLNKPHPPFESAEKFKGGVYILSPEGKLLDFIAIPVDEVTNCAFGGADLKTLFITAGGTPCATPHDTPRGDWEQKHRVLRQSHVLCFGRGPHLH